MRKFLFLILGMVMLSASLYAQNRTITGRVTDAQNKGVPFASVTVKGTTVGTTTNDEGNFTLSLPPKAETIVISSVSFADQEIS